MKSFERINIFNYVVIGILILVVISLILTLYNKSFNVIPMWLVESVVVGIFTLVGAGTGAFLAGQFTLKSVEKQIEHAKQEDEKVRIANSDTALRIIKYSIEDIFIVFEEVTPVFYLDNSHQVVVKRAINEFSEPINRIDNLLQNTDLLSKLSNDYIIAIPSKIRRDISYLKNVKSAVINRSSFDNDYTTNIGKNLDMTHERLKETVNEIETIIYGTSANS